MTSRLAEDPTAYSDATVWPSPDDALATAGRESAHLDVVDNSPHRPPSRFRVGRWFLLAEGVAMAELGGLAMAGQGAQPVRGAPSLWWGMMLTPVRSALLFAFGVVAVVATLNRRATMIATATALLISLVLTVLGDAALATGVPRQWGVDPHNAGLYAVLVLYNFALLTWLLPDLWERREASPREQPAERNALQER